MPGILNGRKTKSGLKKLNSPKKIDEFSGGFWQFAYVMQIGHKVA